MMTSNDSDSLQMSGFKKQMLYISLISAVVVACTFAEMSFKNKFSQFSSVTAAHRDIKTTKDRQDSAPLGGNFKIPNNSLSIADSPDHESTSDKSRLGIPLNNQKKKGVTLVWCAWVAMNAMHLTINYSKRVCAHLGNE